MMIEGEEIVHTHSPHVYVVYWPEVGVIKVGISNTQERWEWWQRRGAIVLATSDVCCENHARNVERAMLKTLAKWGSRAFKSEADARFALGHKRGGYTECYRLVQSPRFGETPLDEYDYERAYGLMLPHEFLRQLDAYNFGQYPVTGDWRRSA